MEVSTLVHTWSAGRAWANWDRPSTSSCSSSSSSSSSTISSSSASSAGAAGVLGVSAGVESGDSSSFTCCANHAYARQMLCCESAGAQVALGGQGREKEGVLRPALCLIGNLRSSSTQAHRLSTGGKQKVSWTVGFLVQSTTPFHVLTRAQACGNCAVPGCPLI